MARYTSPTHLRRLFNVKSERLMRWLFGPQFRVWMALQAKSYARGMTQADMNRLIDRWMHINRRAIDSETETADGPSVAMA